MKLKFKRTIQFTIDTAKERKRIRKCFKGETREMLERFMDAFEAGDMKKACSELYRSWWRGRDEKAGCPRAEFIGLVHSYKYLANSTTFGDLAWQVANSPKGEWEIKKEGE